MTSSPSSGLSAEAKEFVPTIQTPTSSIPLYVDENTVASIYPSDQAPFMVQAIYPMMLNNGKMIEVSTANLPFPEIEFHIQPSQQQQFHIDSCSNLTQTSSTPGSSTATTSQIVLLPTSTSSSGTGVTTTGFYPTSSIIYSPSDSIPSYYPIDYCEQPLINFSVQQSAILTKPSRISSRVPRPTSFRSQHGNSASSYRTGNHPSNNYSNRNSYYDYHPRRNGTTPYASHSGRGNSSTGKRISSSYHQQDYNSYYHHPSARSRGYAARSSQYHDDQRKDPSEYYSPSKEFYENEYQPTNESNEDETPFEFRPEDFPSLPINQQLQEKSDKTPSQTVTPSMSRSTSSWNAIVSAPRPHSTSPHSVAPTSTQSQDQRSDRSRSFNTSKPSSNHTANTKKSSRSTASSTMTKSKSLLSASNLIANDESQTVSSKPSSKIESDSADDGFMQTKHQQRRLKRKNRMREDLFISNDDEDRSVSPSTVDQTKTPSKSDLRSESHSISNKNKSLGLIEKVHQMDLNDRLSTDAFSDVDIQKEKSDTRTSAISSTTNDKSFQSNIDENRSIKKTNHHSQTDTTSNRTENEDDQNSTVFSSSTNNSSDTSDYDDAVDNLVEE